MSQKIHSKLFIKGKLHTLTGLHIGGNSGGLKVGGVNSVVVRNPLDNQPYIPGSSLRGKMRSLLERARGPEEKNSEEGGYNKEGLEKKNSEEGGYNKEGPGTNPKTLLGKLFGVGASEKSNEPTRLIVRDSFLTKESAKKLELASNTDMPMTEVKTEVSINRISSKANPREIERVPAGAIFDLNFILTLYDKDEEIKFLNLFFESLSLIEGDSLGGHGSRGYGRVLFKELKISQKTVEDYKNPKQEEQQFQDYQIFLEALKNDKKKAI
ncbi:MAG: type III-A CRISPR-associated RAMP protein Csm3 [Bdellovibrionales bacterium]|nr:type III-A CRISPR-associated RAMP protein Csm3 [Bdellovibrionales bacterium]